MINWIKRVFECRTMNILCGAFMIIVGTVLGLVSFIITFEPVMKFDILNEITMLFENIIFILNIIVWICFILGIRSDYQSKDLSKPLYVCGTIFSITMIVGAIWEIPGINHFGGFLIGIFWIAIAVGGGFLIKIVMKGQNP
jgi:hypothetical protein